MKKLFVFFAIFTSLSVYSKNLDVDFQYKSYEEAKKSNNRLEFKVISTKAGMFSSDVFGYVKSFRYSAEISAESLLVKNAKLIFPIQSMDTDNSMRDEKMKNLCLGMKQYGQVELIFNQPFTLNLNKSIDVQALAKIRGKLKPVTVSLKTEKSDGTIKIKASSAWSLKKLEIPDPSIFIAKLSDEISINVLLNIDLTK